MRLMPSRVEPCGLSQLYSMRYGTPPIVHATGGLRDTVTEADQPGGTGFLFEQMTAADLLGAVDRALALYADRRKWNRVARTGMRADFSWTRSAAEYDGIYREILF